MNLDAEISARRRQGDLDADRMTFLERLDASELRLTPWEQEFVGSYIDSGKGQQWFTTGRRVAADKLMEKYPRVGRVAPRAPVAPAKSGFCMCYVRGEDGHQKRCGEKSGWRRNDNTQFEYCEACADIAREACKRKQLRLDLVRITS